VGWQSRASGGFEMIFMRPSTIVVDCVTNKKLAFQAAKPELAIKTLPDWWKNLPKTKEVTHIQRPTMRYCRGFIDLYSIGFVQKMWCDFSIYFAGDGNCRWEFADEVSHAEFHPYWQRENFLAEATNAKLLSPWKFIERKGTKFFTAPCFWNYKSLPDYSVMPGILDFKYQNSPHFNLMLHQSGDKQGQIIIEYGTPVVHYIPLTDKKIKLKYHLVDDAEFERSSNFMRLKFFNGYKFVKGLGK